MRTPTAKRILLWLAVATVLLGLFAWINHQPRLSVTVLNPKFRLLTAKISYGTTHKLYMDSTAMGQMTDLLRRADFKAGSVPLPARTPTPGYALVVPYSGDFKPNELCAVQAELMDDAGTVTRLSHGAGYTSEGNPQYEDGKIWLLDSPLTNGVTIRLSWCGPSGRWRALLPAEPSGQPW